MQVPYDPDRGPQFAADSAAERAELGVGLIIFYLPTPHTPAVLEPLARALEPLL